MNRPATANPAQLFNAAVDAYEQGDTGRALRMLEDLLRAHPSHPGALYMSGSLLLAQGDPGKALPRLTAAAQSLPGNGEVAQVLADAHFRLDHWHEAGVAYQAALQSGRKNLALLNNLGIVLKELGDIEAAIAIYREALDLAPDDADLHNNLGIALNRLQDYNGAMAAYRRSLELRPDDVSAWSNLAMLYEQSNLLEEAEDAVRRGLALEPGQENLQLTAARCERRRGEIAAGIARLERQLRREDLSPTVRRSMEFELGRSHDMQGDAEHAYPHFVAGNRLSDRIWPELRTGADAFTAELRRRLGFFSQSPSVRLPTSPPESRPSPVFLVGFPRSGTTLMDTMLGAHPAVSVLEEESMLEVTLLELRRLVGDYPEGLARLSSEQVAGLRDLYWHEAEAHLTEAPRLLLLDKNPFHSTHVEFIKLLFPGARFIFALRHPCDVTLSCFMQGFGNNAMMYNFRDLQSSAETYRLTMDLWDQSRRRLDLDVHTLRYEALVDDTQGELRSLLDFLGLPWEESMQDHTGQARKRGRIYTPSYHQVIRPVYRDSLARWQRYRQYYGPALDVLRPYVDAFGYSLD